MYYRGLMVPLHVQLCFLGTFREIVRFEKQENMTYGKILNLRSLKYVLRVNLNIAIRE